MYRLVLIGILFIWSAQFAQAEHIDFRERDMRTIVVGEVRSNPVFYGCQDRRAAIELSTWIDDYGVLFYLDYRWNGEPKVFLYRHTENISDNTPPAAPTNLEIQ